MSDSIMECGHHTYWKTHYQNCMACRAEKAQKELQEYKEALEWLVNKGYVLWERGPIDNPPTDKIGLYTESDQECSSDLIASGKTPLKAIQSAMKSKEVGG